MIILDLNIVQVLLQWGLLYLLDLAALIPLNQFSVAKGEEEQENLRLFIAGRSDFKPILSIVLNLNASANMLELEPQLKRRSFGFLETHSVHKARLSLSPSTP